MYTCVAFSTIVQLLTFKQITYILDIHLGLNPYNSAPNALIGVQCLKWKHQNNCQVVTIGNNWHLMAIMTG